MSSRYDDQYCWIDFTAYGVGEYLPIDRNWLIYQGYLAEHCMASYANDEELLEDILAEQQELVALSDDITAVWVGHALRNMACQGLMGLVETPYYWE